MGIDEMMKAAESEAVAIGSDYVGVAHLMIALLRFDDTLRLLCEKKGITPKQARGMIRAQLGPVESPSSRPLPVAARLSALLARATTRAGARPVAVEDVIAELKNEEDGVVGDFVLGLGLVAAEVRPTRERSPTAPRRGGLLDRLGRDLTDLASSGKLPPRLRRPAIEKQILMALARHTKPNVLLVGEAGVGKTAIVEGLVQRLAAAVVPAGEQGDRASPVRTLAPMRIVAIDASALVAGASFGGELEERLRSLVDEASRLPNLVVFIDEFHALMGIGGSVAAADVLKPALARGDMRIIGATTPKELRAFVERDAAIARRFEQVEVPEPTIEETVAILEQLRETLAKHHGLHIESGAIAAAARLSERYLPQRKLPDKALDVLEEACTRARFKTNLPDGAAICITSEDVASVIAVRAGVALEEISIGERAALTELEAELGKKIVGQDDAIRAVARAVQVSRIGLKAPHRPVGAFLLTGPSGVGKTFLAETVAKLAFGEGSLLRIDGGEYQQAHEISRLVGAPPGYKGHGSEGLLTGHLGRKPHSVILIDEIDKAHGSLCDLLLHVLDSGRLTDGEGKTVDCSHSLFLLTSNHFAENQRKRAPGFALEREHELESEDAAREAQDNARLELAKTLRPEFLGRLDAVLPMRRLDEDARHKVARALLEDARERLASKHAILLWDETVLREAAGRGDAALGARTIRAAIDAEVLGAATDALLRASPSPTASEPLRLRIHREASGRMTLHATPPEEDPS